MTASEYPPLPDVPAYLSWEIPALPLPNRKRLLMGWQAGRCAVCAVHRPARAGLFEDHDHATGLVRGLLCPRCNTTEGLYPHRPTFVRYRERPPTAILGLLLQRGCQDHPLVHRAHVEWENALAFLEMREREGESLAREIGQADALRAKGFVRPDPYRPLILDEEESPLVRAAIRVGHSMKEWRATLYWQQAVAWDRRRGDPPRPYPSEESESAA